MSANLKPVSPVTRVAVAESKHAHDELQARQSKELIVGLSGPVGAGLPSVVDALEKSLAARHYTIVRVKVSSLFLDEAARHSIAIKDPGESSAEFNRIWSLQTVGNDLRSVVGDDMGAQIAMKAIAVHRARDNQDVPISDIEPRKVAYIIDQLKNPKEVLLLRTVYRNLFFMVGVLSSYAARKKALTANGMPKDLAERLMERDRRESDDNGQQLDKTLQHAEFFINNSKHNIPGLDHAMQRFVGLIHGDNGLTPTTNERGMFAAYTASLRSACLSRQVGASIVDVAGNVISTGCNDVPRAGGGLYEPGEGDRRCFFTEGICHNDKHKTGVAREIAAVLVGEGILESDAVRLAAKIKSKSRIKDLIEFSRAVHAEMDAIVTLARTGAARTQGASLFTTTYPCHSCARHIVAAGISTVYYIEPYEKSLAADLHDDAIANEPEEKTSSSTESGMVAFRHFEGVSPHKFTKLFHSSTSRKDGSGRAVPQVPDAVKKLPEYLDDYIELETRVVRRLEGLADDGQQLLDLGPST